MAATATATTSPPHGLATESETSGSSQPQQGGRQPRRARDPAQRRQRGRGDAQSGQSTSEQSEAAQSAQSTSGPPVRGGRGGSGEAQTAQQTSTSSVRGGRGGRQLRGSALAFRPSSVAPLATPSTSNTPVASDLQQSVERNESGPGTGRPRRGGRGGRNQTTVVESRRFAGSLSTVPQAALPSNATLKPDAAAFTPGQAYAPPRAGSPAPSIGSTSSAGCKRRKPQKRRLSKSMAPDLPTRIHEDIDMLNYECAICTGEVVRKSKVWSCHMCWTVFHLDCIKKWSNNSAAAQGGESTVPQWRCPGCNLPQDVKPKGYDCWCGKEHEPRSISGLPPHSCGQTCAKARVIPKQCPHPCELLCHAGPCPPCTHQGQTQRCYCGKESLTKRCVDTNYEGGWSCGKVCDDLLPCSEHNCERECHEGLCGACETRIDARCYCGKEEKAIICCDKDDEKTSRRFHLAEDGQKIEEEWTGLFHCTNVCNRLFDCGKHSCQQSCHPSEGGVTHCPRSPDVVMDCLCGKTPLAFIEMEPRISCEDPIPSCSKLCLKTLDCGHACQEICHAGECRPCTEKIEIKCRCGRTSSTTICHQGLTEPPQCPRVCRATLNCGRHECGERCCSGEKRAAERQAQKRKQRPLNAPRTLDDGIEAEHICTRPCGRLLKCGSHTCEELCHKGPCRSCPEAIFDEISCHCGRTTLHPPLPCGTKPPACRYNCERPKPCGHPQVQHNCHPDEESCPNCPFLTEKACLCGKKTLKNQQCWFTDVRCGEVCGRKLKCGSHSCLKTCHKPGECEDQVSGICTQACGKAKKSCAHPCDEPCHAPFACKEDKPCPHLILVTCPCQHIKKKLRCHATATSPGNTETVIPCTDDCLKVQRNRKLALALDIDPATHSDDHVPYSAETMKAFESLDAKWSTDIERQFRVFANEADERRLRFKPMKPTERAFIHALAEDFGLDSESMDPDPHRHVLVLKSPRFVAAPGKTLRDCARIRRSQAQAAAAERRDVAVREREAAAKSNVADEWNGYLVTGARFGLTIKELEAEIRAALGPKPGLALTIHFLPIGDVALRASSALGTDDDAKQLTHTLRTSKAPLARALASAHLGNLELARLDTSLNVLRKESDSVAGGGWSRVAARAAAPRREVQTREPVGRGGGFTVLANLAARKREEAEREKERERKDREEREEIFRRRRGESVVDDWEEAVDREDGVVEGKVKDEAKDAATDEAKSEAKDVAEEESQGHSEVESKQETDDAIEAASQDPIDPATDTVESVVLDVESTASVAITPAAEAHAASE